MKIAYPMSALKDQWLIPLFAPVFGFVGALLVGGEAHGQWGYGWDGGYHASTAEEGYQRGMADVIRSQGAANLMNSAAAKNVEDARSKALDNRLKYIENFYEIKKHNREYKQYTRQPKVTREQMFEISRARAPKRPSPSEIDPLTGQIQWPPLLQTDAFQKGRRQLDAIFADRVQHKNSSDPDTLAQVRHVAEAMQGQLKENISQYPSYKYINAKKFLDGIIFESTNPVY